MTFAVARAFLGRTWPLIVGGLLCLGLVISQLQLRNSKAETRQARTELKAETDFRVVLKDTLDAPADDKPTLLRTAGVRAAESKDRKVTLERISRETLVTKRRADAADAELKRVQAANTKAFAASRREIAELQNRKPSGDPTKDWKTLDEDSQVAWKGWK